MSPCWKAGSVVFFFLSIMMFSFPSLSNEANVFFGSACEGKYNTVLPASGIKQRSAWSVDSSQLDSWVSLLSFVGICYRLCQANTLVNTHRMILIIFSFIKRYLQYTAWSIVNDELHNLAFDKRLEFLMRWDLHLHNQQKKI